MPEALFALAFYAFSADVQDTDSGLSNTGWPSAALAGAAFLLRSRVRVDSFLLIVLLWRKR